jgi:hypothetical protein
MARFLLLMHDAGGVEDAGAWGPYLEKLRGSGRFEGGSSVGATAVHRKGGFAAHRDDSLVGYLIIGAENLESARAFLEDNPVFEAGGTVEICELVED